MTETEKIQILSRHKYKYNFFYAKTHLNGFRWLPFHFWICNFTRQRQFPTNVTRCMCARGWDGDILHFVSFLLLRDTSSMNANLIISLERKCASVVFMVCPSISAMAGNADDAERKKLQWRFSNSHALWWCNLLRYSFAAQNWKFGMQ